MSATDEVLPSRLLAIYGRARKNPGTQSTATRSTRGFNAPAGAVLQQTRSRRVNTPPPPNALACRRHVHHSCTYCPGAVVALAEVAVTVPAVFVVRAAVVLAVVALILLGVPFSVAGLSGVLGFVVGVAALLGPEAPDICIGLLLLIFFESSTSSWFVMPALT